MSASRRRPVLTWHDAQGAHSRVIDARVTLGAAPGVDVVVADPMVSRIHCELEPREDGVWLRDLDSRNGTVAAGLRVGSVRLDEGVTFTLGATTFSVAWEREASPVALSPDARFGPLLGRSVVMRALFARLPRVAQVDATVLITGETGTGKELVAEALHGASRRAAQPFVIVDCGALPETLLEAELFGHARGAFTGAQHARAGAIESAEGGTVFLDEIGELPLAVQPKLLRALESRMVRRLGESQHRKVDVRFIAATHRDLRAMVNQGAFREDLYFRLAVLPIEVPPLRARPDDVALLVEHFLPPDATGAVTPALMHELQSRPWLGNVRELRNFVDRAMALGAHEALALSRDVPTRAAAAAGAGAEGGFPEVALDTPFKALRERCLDHLERVYLVGLLERHHGNVSAVAQAAGLDRTYVHRLIRKHDLGRP